ncbi:MULTISPECIES: RHS repeat-associated core domain-containing protein [unclassified Dysgonomonas]|uniref:RHS repeat domain-containing protein n=1 Tax=unclassified Dysgonomonas TaxID=2630389 RepID=UPI0025C0F17C|nr:MULTISPECIES: RHS repeat-associated core domain-containing protein [unclassified Dysgonomonas]HMM04986.1 RHS repeat-associated core domain-containing protein [Dysgonomonas sp.]
MIINSPTAKAKNYYTYSASGVKLKTEQRYDPNYTVTPSNATNDGLADYKNTDYAGNIICETVKSGSTITNKTRILVSGGYIEGGVYYYYLTDHLGNNRVVANASGTVIQRNHYYPFGMSFADTPLAEQGKQPYKYNGKELDQMHQLNLYDNLARLYDPVIPRTPTPDPHAEKYYNLSPYSWIGNNPMRVIDPLGTDTVHVNPDGTAQRYADGTVVSNPGEGYALIQDKPLLTDEKGTPQVVIEANAPVKSPFDYWAISLSGSAVCFVGFYGDITIGIIGKDGIFIQPSIGFGGGFDISGSVNIKQGIYKGDGKPTATSLEGLSRDISLGASFVNVGLTQDGAKNPNFVRMERPYNYGTSWDVYSGGVTFGSKSLVGGHFGLGNTLGTYYLYKK